MKIAIVQPRITYYNGGGEYYPMDSIYYLSKRYPENQYLILTTETKLPYTKKYLEFEKKISNNVKIIKFELPKNISFLYSIPAGVKRYRWDIESLSFANLVFEYIANHRDIDIIWSYYIMDFPFKIKVPTVLNLLGYPRTFSEYRESLLMQYTEIVSISKNVVLKWNSILEFPIINKYTILNQGIDLKNLKEDVGIFNNEYVNILFAGRLMKRKGVLVLLEAFKEILSDKKIKIRLHIFGEGELNEYINKFIINNNLSMNIYNHGQVSNLNLYMKASDITVFPSLKGEGLMSVVLEAMHYNGVVVTTKNNGNEEIIIDGENGFLLTNDDNLKTELINILLKLYSNKELRKKIKTKAKEGIKRFSWDNYCDNFIKISKKVLEDNS